MSERCPLYPQKRTSELNGGSVEECRKLAAKVDRPEDKQVLETMARAWDRVANERETEL